MPSTKVSGFFVDDVGDAAKSIPRDGRARAWRYEVIKGTN